jgi:aminotransferase
MSAFAETAVTPSLRARALPPSGLVEILRLARSRGAADLAIGSPSFPSAGEDLIAAACAALRSGSNQYEDPRGHAGLRAAAARYHGADPDTEITVTAGATEGLTAVLQALVDPGDEVIVLEPYFEAYPAAIRLAGGRPRFVRLHTPGLRWDPRELERAFSARTRAVIVNSPHNPTGRVFTAEELAGLTALCERWNSTLISDEVYAEFVDEPASVLLPSAVETAIPVVTLRSLSKSHAVSGWRIGWIHASPELTQAFRTVHEALVMGTAGPLQAAAAVILDRRPGWTAEQRAALADKRRRTVDVVRAAGFSTEMPQGACYLFARIPKDWPDAAQTARRLVLDHGVATAPGRLFFADPAAGDRHLRFAYNKSTAVLDLALERLAAVAASAG